MKIIGIVGGVASGKSFVAECFRELGAVALDGDRVGHEVLLLPEVEEAVHRRWGDPVFTEEGHIDRRQLGKIVFAEGEEGRRELEFLESLTHGRIGERLAAEADRLRQKDAVPAAIIDAPVLLKAGWDDICDEIVFVDTPLEQRLERAKTRGWDAEELDRRERAQLSLDTKRERASTVIDNSRSREETRQRVREYWERIVDVGENA